MNIFWTMGDMKTLYIWKNSEFFKLFDGRTFRIVRTHPEELHVYEGRTSNSTFWQFSEKVVGVKKFDQVTAQKSFGKRSELFSPKKWPRTHPEELLVEILTIFSNIFEKKKKKSKNDENWHFAKFGCRGRSAFGIGAKHI